MKHVTQADLVDLRALTLWRPWPWAILHAPEEKRKRLENRPWTPWAAVVGRWFAIHAGAKRDGDGALFIGRHLDMSYGEIWSAQHAQDEGLVGMARVVRCIDRPGDAPTGQAEWFIGPYAWVLEDAFAFPEPIPCRGALGLWRIPEELVLATKAQQRWTIEQQIRAAGRWS